MEARSCCFGSPTSILTLFSRACSADPATFAEDPIRLRHPAPRKFRSLRWGSIIRPGLPSRIPSHMKSDSGNAADAALHAAVAEDCDTYPCKFAHAEFIRVVPSDGPQADAFPATMLTSQNGIRESHSGPKYGRIEIGDHKLTKIDRWRDLATQDRRENGKSESRRRCAPCSGSGSR